MPKKILITGANGLIGTRLTELLLEEGYEPILLLRSSKKTSEQSFLWNPNAGTLNKQALHQVDTIIHLAGVSVAEKRWTKKYKKEILNSRVLSARMLYNVLSHEKHSVKTFISASATGYYGAGNEQQIFTEEDEPGTDFLAEVTRQWEYEADRFQLLNIRVIKIRIGMVLSKKGGALKKMTIPIRLGVGALLGSGKQYVPWIHIDDLCRIFSQAVSNKKMQGVYNGVTSWCTNAELTKAIATVLHKPLWMPPVPAFILKIMLGEMASIVITGSKVSSEKIKSENFVFQHPRLQEALQALLSG